MLSPKMVSLIADLMQDSRRLDERIETVSAEIEALALGLPAEDCCKCDRGSLRSTKGYPPSSLCHHWSLHWASDGGSEGMASHYLSEVKHFEIPSSLGSTASLPKPERRMLGWTNGLPGATMRLGATMANRVFPVAMPQVHADTHVGRE